MSTGRILDPTELPSRDRGGGISTVPMVTSAIGAGQMLNGVTSISPGAAVPEHFHNCEESVLVLSGSGEAHVGGVATRVTPGIVTWIPAGVQHFFANPAGNEPLRIFWTYASVDATRTIVATGVTTRIDEEHGLTRSDP